MDGQAAIFHSWGLKVEYAKHVFDKHGFLAGTDADRVSDINEAICDPDVRAIVATRGGKGSYRIVDHLDYSALRKDPKFLVGFSDITALHFAVWNQLNIVSLHGGLFGGPSGEVRARTQATLQRALMADENARFTARDNEPTAALTTGGTAQGPLLGGSLGMMGTAAGWLLPDLRGAIVLIEAFALGPGLVDRTLLMLRRAGHLRGISGVAIGQFEGCNFKPPTGMNDLLREHLSQLDVPVLGGLPVGHGHDPETVPLGRMARLNADQGVLEIVPE